MRAWKRSICVLFLSLGLAGCNGDGNEGACDLLAPDCADGLVCEVTEDGTGFCYAPLVIHGTVLDATDGNPVEGALVQAVDPNGAAVGTTDATDGDGDFVLTVPATRNAEGNPLSGAYTLRVQAAGYQPFPTAIRPALPLDASSAQGSVDEGWVIESPLTTVKLLPLPGDTSNLGSISGTVLADSPSGVLLVAQATGTGHTGYSDAAGAYTIFNLPAGSYSVQGYLAGLQLDSAETTLAAGEDKDGVDLVQADRALSTVSGNVQIVNAPGGSKTSVILAVESTFVEAAARGEAPPGLHAGEIEGAFTIENVPDGDYVVLAGFENDDLVRDPDQTIGGTAIVRIQVPDPESGNTVTLPEGFKVTEALAVVSPGATGPERVQTATPTFEWADDSSEEGFDVHVFDAFGEEIWSVQIGPVSGENTVTHTYAGPTLQEGMYYQFKTVSTRDKSGEWTAISTTEDLKGVFYYETNP